MMGNLTTSICEFVLTVKLQVNPWRNCSLLIFFLFLLMFSKSSQVSGTFSKELNPIDSGVSSTSSYFLKQGNTKKIESNSEEKVSVVLLTIYTIEPASSISTSSIIEQEQIKEKLSNPSSSNNKSTKRNEELNENVKSRFKRGFFVTEDEKDKLEEEYGRSFRLFWFLAGVAIFFFILIFILTLLFYLECFCCAYLTRKKDSSSSRDPMKSINPITVITTPPVVENTSELGGVLYQSGSDTIEIDGRRRSPSVLSATLYTSHHRLSQEQVNAIQLESQSRRNSYIPPIPTSSQSLLPSTSGLIDVNVVQEQRPDTINA